MNKQKIEIKIQSKNENYFESIKKNIITVIKFIFSILVLAGTLYIGFYILLLGIMIIIASYLFNKLKSQ
tara:strand:- start:633 stop:839 length:207 start_codon:yes stop_codon:yes gene_type:complete